MWHLEKCINVQKNTIVTTQRGHSMNINTVACSMFQILYFAEEIQITRLISPQLAVPTTKTTNIVARFVPLNMWTREPSDRVTVLRSSLPISNANQSYNNEDGILPFSASQELMYCSKVRGFLSLTDTQMFTQEENHSRVHNFPVPIIVQVPNIAANHFSPNF